MTTYALHRLYILFIAAIAWMAAQAIDRGQAHIRAYSDHVSDAPMLEYADLPFAANPHRRLALLAAARGWPRVDWD